jgi:hypothetical protein
MTRHLVTCLAFTALLFVSPTPAAAATFANDSAVYDTVDAIEVLKESSTIADGIKVTGIISGQSAPSELSYVIAGPTDHPARCERLALLAMSKPGKFQLALLRVDGGFTCKLIVRTP